GTATVATAGGWAEVRGNQVQEAVIPPAPVGTVIGVVVTDDGVRWACGEGGVARLREGRWEGYGEAFQCTGLWPTPEGRLWIGTTRGLLYVDADDVIREHGEGRGLPAGWVRGVVPAQPGQAFVLVQNATESHLAWFDGNRWYGYTIPDFQRPLVGLGRVGSDTVLFTSGYAFVIQDAARGSGVPLRPLNRGERLRVLSYRARITPEGVAPSNTEPLPPRAPARLAAVPPNHPTLEAPGFVIRPLGPIGESVYAIRGSGGTVFAAEQNRGVVAVGTQGPGRRFSSQDLVGPRDLQIASDPRGRTWILAEGGSVAQYNEGRLQRVAGPEGASCRSLTAASRGVYLGCTTDTRNLVRVYRRTDDGWAIALERQLTFGVAEEEPAPEVVEIPMLGVRDNEEAWLAVRVRMPDGSGPRLRGLVQLAGESTTYHHYYATPEKDGEGALQIPDDFSAMDLNESGMVWLAALSGAVRLGNHQAIVFGEARGVRGEVVSDVLVGSSGRVWLAAAEGPGYYQNRSFEFRMPPAVRAAQPVNLAVDSQGNVWGAGPNGLIRFDGSNWSVFGEDAGLPTQRFVDVESDAGGRLWVLSEDRLLILSAPEARSATPE
ncbi:MAG: hypothetical protein AAGE52_32375, partial [Myxococcota bacterium]